MSGFYIVAGTLSLSDTSGQKRDIEYCLTPPNTSDAIAICKLSSPLVFNEKIGKIKVETKMVGAGMNCISTGWGLQSNHRTMNFTTISNKKCNEKLNT